MKLQLKRPLAIFDLETTGINIQADRIVEIAIKKLNPNGSTEVYHQKINPTISIPIETSLIHGIYDEDVKNSPTFKDLAPEIMNFIKDCDLGGYNSNKFDIPVLAEELMRAEVDFDFTNTHFVDIQNIFHKMEQRTLSAAYQFYCDKQLENAHSALYDTEATLDILFAQVDKYEDLATTIPELAKFTNQSNFDLVDFAGRIAKNEKGDVIYNFGKHKGKTIEDVNKIEPGYYGWMLEAEFPLYTKKVLKAEMERIKEKRNSSQNPPQNMEQKLDALKNKFNKK